MHPAISCDVRFLMTSTNISITVISLYLLLVCIKINPGMTDSSFNEYAILTLINN